MYDIKSYVEAASVKEAVSLLKDNENAQLIAGGTDILIKAREGKKGYVQRDLIGIMRIDELNGIYVEEDGTVIIGAASSFTKVEENPFIKKNIPSLSVAVGSVGGPQVRNMGTIGGNICNGATSGDSGSTLLALEAVLEIEGKDGKRDVPIGEFYLGPGKVALNHEDILVKIKIKKEKYEGYKGHYIKFSPRKAMDIATLGCSVLIKEKDGIIEDLKIAYGVAGPTPLRATEAENYAKNRKISEETLENIGKECLKASRARDSWRASKAFREQLMEELPKRALKIALGGQL